MAFRVSTKTEGKKEVAPYIKNFIKPIGLKFKGVGSVRECKQFYKKYHKEIGIPADVEGHWFDEGENGKVLQLCELLSQPDEKNIWEVEVLDGVSIIYNHVRYQIKK